MDFTARQLRAFVLVAQHQSFSRAAAALFITPSGLSLLIRELESQLGFRLFDRTTRHVGLTRQGREFLPVVGRALHEIEHAAKGIGQELLEASRHISVGAPPLIAANVMPQAIREFQNARPDWEVNLYAGTLNSIAQRVEEGKLNLGLGTFEPAPALRRSPFFQFSLVLISSDSSPAAGRTSVSWSSLAGATLLSLDPSSPTQRLIDRRFKLARVQPRCRMVLGSLDMQIAMVEAGHGLAVIPSYGLPVCRGRKITMARLVNPVATSDFHLISHRGHKLPPGAESFITFLQTYIKHWAGHVGIS
jgi:DNA-binding transcriptional LysR family regulator